MKLSPLADAIRQMIWAEQNNCSVPAIEERAAILDAEIRKVIAEEIRKSGSWPGFGLR